MLVLTIPSTFAHTHTFIPLYLLPLYLFVFAYLPHISSFTYHYHTLYITIWLFTLYVPDTVTQPVRALPLFLLRRVIHLLPARLVALHCAVTLFVRCGCSLVRSIAFSLHTTPIHHYLYPRSAATFPCLLPLPILFLCITPPDSPAFSPLPTTLPRPLLVPQYSIPSGLGWTLLVRCRTFPLTLQAAPFAFTFTVAGLLQLFRLLL